MSMFDRNPDMARVVIGLKEEITQACEPYVQQALRDAEIAVRDRVAQFAVQLTNETALSFRGAELTIKVDFGKKT